MAVKTNAQLAAFFNTGDQPSETEFGHLIDTIQPPSVTLGDENKTLNAADHAFRTLIMPNISGARTITLPTPVLDVWYHIIHLPLVQDGHDLIFRAADETNFFEGSIINHNIGGATTAQFGDGSTFDLITLPTSSHLDLWLYGKSSTIYYMWGHSVSDTTIAVTDG